jgi:hypothetical protein
MSKMFPSASITPQEAVEVMADLSWPMRSKFLTVMLGYVGQGKTVGARLAAENISSNLGRTLVNMRDLSRAPNDDEFVYWEINCATSDRSDFQIPWIENGSYDLMVLQTFRLLAENPDAHGMIVFDEIAKNPELAPIFAEIARERRFGTTFKLPDNIMVVGTGNRATDNASSFELPEDLRNRAMILDVQSDANSFLDHEGDTLDPTLVAAIKLMAGTAENQLIFNYGNTAAPSASTQNCTFRSMSCFNDVIKLDTWDWHKPHHRHAGGGLIGSGAFTTIAASQGFGNQLLMVNAYFDDPEANKAEIRSVFVHNSLGVENLFDFKYALMVGFLNKIKKDANNFETACKYLDIINDGDLYRSFLECAKQVDESFAKTSRYASNRAADIRKAN